MKVEIKDLSGNSIHTVDLDDGDYSLYISKGNPGKIKKTLSTMLHIKNEWMSSVGLVSLILFTFVFDYFYMDIHEKDVWNTTKENIIICAVTATIVAIISAIAKALSGRFQLKAAINLCLSSLLLVYIWGNDLMGFRWILPKFFWIEEVYYTGIILWMGLVGWHLSKMFFTNVKPNIRFFVIAILLGVYASYASLNYLPIRDRYKYLNVKSSPPRPEILESKPISLDKFLIQIDPDR